MVKYIFLNFIYFEFFGREKLYSAKNFPVAIPIWLIFQLCQLHWYAGDSALMNMNGYETEKKLACKSSQTHKSYKICIYHFFKFFLKLETKLITNHIFKGLFFLMNWHLEK